LNRLRQPLPFPSGSGGGVRGVSGLLSLAGAAGSATGLSLRSLRAARDLFRAQAFPGAGFAAPTLPAGKHLRRPGRPVALQPYYACVPPAPEHATNQDPATGSHLRRGHDMDATTTSPPRPSLARSPLRRADHAGGVRLHRRLRPGLPPLRGADPAWLNDIEPSFWPLARCSPGAPAAQRAPWRTNTRREVAVLARVYPAGPPFGRVAGRSRPRFAAFSGIYRHHHAMPNDYAQMTSPEYAFPQH
jgi:hypothetical protein